MANQSNKKAKKDQNKTEFFLKSAIYAVTAIYLLICLYSIFVKGYELKGGDITGFIVLSLVNFILYHLIITLRNAFYVNYIYDILIINLLVMLMINFHWKFWFLYLSIPAYGLVKLGVYLFHYTKTIGQATPEELEQMRLATEQSKKRKNKDKF